MKSFLTKDENDRLVAAIGRAEKETSGEIVVTILRRIKGDPYVAARDYFITNKLDQTQGRNAVLIFLAYVDKKLAVIGDTGINEKVTDEFWETIISSIISEFKLGHYIDGLEAGIAQIGRQLKNYFPYQRDDVNELPDTIRIEN